MSGSDINWQAVHSFAESRLNELIAPPGESTARDTVIEEMQTLRPIAQANIANTPGKHQGGFEPPPDIGLL